MKQEDRLNNYLSTSIEILIRIGLLFLLVLWCFRLLLPFSTILLWGAILALVAEPIYNWLKNIVGHRSQLAASLLALIGLALVVAPSWWLISSMISGVQSLLAVMETDGFKIPPPSQSVADWPLIGQKAFDFWSQASDNLESLVIQYQDQISTIGRNLLGEAVAFTKSLLQIVAATILAVVLLAIKGTDELANKFFTKLIGERGLEFKQVVVVTVRNVTKGVIGVAFAQSMLIGIGFLFAGIPYAGIWTLLVFVFALLQLPAMLIIIPAVIYLFSVSSPVAASLWTVYLILAGASDNVLKPILLGKGALVPIPVIFVGVLGGFMLSGFIGLFTGAIVLSIGYKLFLGWLEEKQTVEIAQPGEESPGLE